jgi:hypothetical protein
MRRYFVVQTEQPSLGIEGGVVPIPFEYLRPRLVDASSGEDAVLAASSRFSVLSLEREVAVDVYEARLLWQFYVGYRNAGSALTESHSYRDVGPVVVSKKRRRAP